MIAKILLGWKLVCQRLCDSSKRRLCLEKIKMDIKITKAIKPNMIAKTYLCLIGV